MISEDKIHLAELAAEITKGNELSIEQEAQLNLLLDKYPHAKSIIEEILLKQSIEVDFDLKNIDVDQEWNTFVNRNKIQPLKKNKRFEIIKWASAAVLLLSISFAGYLLLNREVDKDYVVIDKVYGQKNDILPGKSGAILEIEGGKTIVLSEIDKTTAIANGVDANSEQLSYASQDQSINPKHVVKVPLRSTYQVQLSDGTKVWINSDSRIEYLANFSSQERRLKLEGQAYFEVAKDSNRPFIVESNGIDVRAIGTAFDVNTYNKTKIQLTEGAIEVTKAGHKVNLKPGQQVIDESNQLKVATIDDLEETTAWWNGYFYYNNTTLKEILDDIQKWYGVKIKVETTIGNKRYDGSISKTSTLAEVCNVLKDLTKYKFQIDDETLIIR